VPKRAVSTPPSEIKTFGETRVTFPVFPHGAKLASPAELHFISLEFFEGRSIPCHPSALGTPTSTVVTPRGRPVGTAGRSHATSADETETPATASARWFLFWRDLSAPSFCKPPKPPNRNKQNTTDPGPGLVFGDTKSNPLIQIGALPSPGPRLGKMVRGTGKGWEADPVSSMADAAAARNEEFLLVAVEVFLSLRQRNISSPFAEEMVPCSPATLWYAVTANPGTFPSLMTCCAWPLFFRRSSKLFAARETTTRPGNAAGAAHKTSADETISISENATRSNTAACVHTHAPQLCRCAP
jgi:hypothetical protein